MSVKKKKTQRIRRAGPIEREERKRLKEIREKVRHEFPPLDTPRLQPVTSGLGARLRLAREAAGLTWYAVAKRAGIPNPSTVRDIEYGRDTKLSSVEAIAEALGLSFELVAIPRSSEMLNPETSPDIARHGQSLRRFRLARDELRDKPLE